jgi:hypothetical protein
MAEAEGQGSERAKEAQLASPDRPLRDYYQTITHGYWG